MFLYPIKKPSNFDLLLSEIFILLKLENFDDHKEGLIKKEE